MKVADLIHPVRMRAESVARFQDYLNGLPTPAAQKTAITDAFVITGEDAELLIQVYQLETA